MARSIDTVKGRAGLKVRHEPHWQKVRRGCHLGYRKMTTEGDGAWVAKYRDADTGSRVGQSLGTFGELPASERYDAAKRAAEEWFAHMGAGGSKGDVTVAGACAAYVKHLRDEGREKAAADAESRFKRWVDSSTIGKTAIQKASHAKFSDWRRQLSKTKTLPHDKDKKGERKPRSSSALNRDMASVRAAMNFALRERLVTTDSAWKVALLPAERASGRRQIYLEPEQRRQLTEAATAEVRPLLLGLSLLPLRPGALAQLTVADFDSRLGVLTIDKDKNARARKIQLPETTAKFFVEQARGKAETAPLIARGNGVAWNKDSWKGPIKDAVKAAALPAAATAYSLRHSTITDLIARYGLDLMSVAILSDTSIEMIEQHYGHLISDRATRALGKLAL